MQLTHNDNLFTARELPITLVCDHIYFQQNIGSLFRIAEAFGVKEVLFYGKDIPLNFRKINKTSRSTHLQVPHQVFEDFTSLSTYLKSNNLEIISLEITNNSVPLQDITLPKTRQLALILGSEIDGISEELLKISNQIVHIIMYGKNSSMNVVQAASIALYQISQKL